MLYCILEVFLDYGGGAALCVPINIYAIYSYFFGAPNAGRLPTVLSEGSVLSVTILVMLISVHWLLQILAIKNAGTSIFLRKTNQIS